MDDPVKKLRLLLKFAMRVLSQLLSDLRAHYSTPYPLLLIVGVLRRIIRRANTLWQAKGRPTWTAFLKAHKDLWALDFTCVFDIQGVHVFMISCVILIRNILTDAVRTKESTVKHRLKSST